MIFGLPGGSPDLEEALRPKVFMNVIVFNLMIQKVSENFQPFRRIGEYLGSTATSTGNSGNYFPIHLVGGERY